MSDALTMYARLDEVIHELGEAYHTLAILEAASRRAEVDAERTEAKVFLGFKATEGKSDDWTRKLTTDKEEVYQARMFSISEAARHKAAWGKVKTLEREHEMLRSGLGMERAKLSAGVELGDHA